MSLSIETYSPYKLLWGENRDGCFWGSGFRVRQGSGVRGQGSEPGSYFGCRTVNFSAAAALFSFSSKDEKATAVACPEDLSSPAADR